MLYCLLVCIVYDEECVVDIIHTVFSILFSLVI